MTGEEGMRRMRAQAGLIGLLIAIVLQSGSAQAVTVPWINGDFELGDATWTYASTTTFEDADEDGDLEASLVGCGDGGYLISRGATKGDVPATSHLTFEVEQGALDFYSFRMIIVSPEDPEAWANNLLNLSTDLPTYDDDYWFDDQVLAWEDWQASGPLSGSVDLDPVDANAYNIDGWDAMSDAERTAFLSTSLHMTLVAYGCATGSEGTTLDNFAWSL